MTTLIQALNRSLEEAGISKLHLEQRREDSREKDMEARPGLEAIIPPIMAPHHFRPSTCSPLSCLKLVLKAETG